MASPFASFVTRVVELPFDPPQTVTIQKLTGRALEKARRESQIASADALVRMGGAQLQRELVTMQEDQKRRAAASSDDQARATSEVAPVDLLLTHDRQLVLRAGLKAWTYERPCTDEAKDDLDDQAADFIAREILKLSLPGGEEARKNA